MRNNKVLWVVQGLLAALFLFAGGAKLVLPAEAMKGPIELPVAFLRFIGVAEVLGAVGLIVPWLTHIRPILTPLAAFGLIIIMAGATVLSGIGIGLASAAFPAIVGSLALLVAKGRWTATVSSSSYAGA